MSESENVMLVSLFGLCISWNIIHMINPNLAWSNYRTALAVNLFTITIGLLKVKILWDEVYRK